MSNALSAISNYYFPTPDSNLLVKPKDESRNISSHISPIQFMRMRSDVKGWRDSVAEAENAYYPHRVRMQRLFQDTILNGQVFACVERRKDLTLLRDFKICDIKGQPNEDLKAIFRNNDSTVNGDLNSASWFDDFINYSLDAKFFGYSLVSLGDVINGAYPEISLVKRWNVSPDRLNVPSTIYGIDGQKFMEDPFKDWTIYIPTVSEIGSSQCGFGLLYKVAPYELMIRNNISYNADFNEVFNQPLRKGTTNKTDETERAEFERALATMGHNAYIMLDDGSDTIEFVESKNVGNAYQSFENFEQRLNKIISKIILGHADAIDSTAGKLGNDGKESPATQAKRDIQTKDGLFIQSIVNTKLLPRMRKHGFKIPNEFHFEYLNDLEKEEIRAKEDSSNQATANIAVAMATAGMQMDAAYFTDRTGIPAQPITPIINGKEGV